MKLGGRQFVVRSGAKPPAFTFSLCVSGRYHMAEMLGSGRKAPRTRAKGNGRMDRWIAHATHRGIPFATYPKNLYRRNG
jgi:hypothetical protein